MAGSLLGEWLRAHYYPMNGRLYTGCIKGAADVKNVPADRSSLKPGTGVFILVLRSDDGTLTAIRITVGVGGVMPPM
jgi:hypothetical protein